jgi:hypothetical protein
MQRITTIGNKVSNRGQIDMYVSFDYLELLSTWLGIKEMCVSRLMVRRRQDGNASNNYPGGGKDK